MSPLLTRREGALTRLTLNRPDKANALNAELVDALLAAVAAAHGDGTRLLLLQGEGRNLSAGFDFGGYEEQSEGDLVLRFVRIEQLLQAVYHAPFATLAIAHGKNFGAGADLFAAASVRVAAPDASFRMPGLRFGLQLGTRRLAQRVGGEKARALLADSVSFDAMTARDIGFVTHVAEQKCWDPVVAKELERAMELEADATARLHAATVADSRAADMADLVASAALPGLKARIAAYRKPA
jgi:enoyl-CoA hydratase/carnithine racemase